MFARPHVLQNSTGTHNLLSCGNRLPSLWSVSFDTGIKEGGLEVSWSQFPILNIFFRISMDRFSLQLYLQRWSNTCTDRERCSTPLSNILLPTVSERGFAFNLVHASVIFRYFISFAWSRISESGMKSWSVPVLSVKSLIPEREYLIPSLNYY